MPRVLGNFGWICAYFLHSTCDFFFFQFFVSVLALPIFPNFKRIQQIRWSKSSGHSNSSKDYEFCYALPVNVYTLWLRRHHQMPIKSSFQPPDRRDWPHPLKKLKALKILCRTFELLQLSSWSSSSLSAATILALRA